MLKYFIKIKYFKILAKKHFLVPLLLTIILALFLNIGIIFQLPNYTNLEYIDCLSASMGNRAPELFIGQITIFILFFTFIQFSFTRDRIPSPIIGRYIVNDPTTFIYLGVQISFALILAWFSFFERIIIYNLILCYAIVIISVLISILYFRWIIQSTTAKEMIKINLKDLKLHLSKLNENIGNRDYIKIDSDNKILEILDDISNFILYSTNKEMLIKHIISFVKKEFKKDLKAESIKNLYIEILEWLIIKLRYGNLRGKEFFQFDDAKIGESKKDYINHLNALLNELENIKINQPPSL